MKPRKPHRGWNKLHTDHCLCFPNCSESKGQWIHGHTAKQMWNWLQFNWVHKDCPLWGEGKMYVRHIRSLWSQQQGEHSDWGDNQHELSPLPQVCSQLESQGQRDLLLNFTMHSYFCLIAKGEKKGESKNRWKCMRTYRKMKWTN